MNSGIPCQDWNQIFFKELSAIVGVFVIADEVTTSGSKMDVEKLLIHTRQASWINKVLNIQMNGEVFRINIFEESQGTGVFNSSSNRDIEEEGSEEKSDEAISSDEGEGDEEGVDEYVSESVFNKGDSEDTIGERSIINGIEEFDTGAMAWQVRTQLILQNKRLTRSVQEKRGKRKAISL